MKVYTGGGDRGKTSLFSGERVSKSHFRIESSGVLDELNSILGVLIGKLPPKALAMRREELFGIQSDLFHLGARLATLSGSPLAAAVRDIQAADSRFLELAIDAMDADLPQLRGFILPGGHPAAAWAHVARTVCRRAERSVVRLVFEDQDESFDRLEGVVVYLNRLSDYLFVLARYCNHTADVMDVHWRK